MQSKPQEVSFFDIIAFQVTIISNLCINLKKGLVAVLIKFYCLRPIYVLVRTRVI